jgi:hypothetical protein
MSRARLFRFFLVRLLPLLVLGLVGARAMAQADPPSRVARLNYLEGAAVFAPAGDNEWIDAVLNRPLTRGDRVWTDKGSRAELQVGSSAVRMDGQAQLEILALDDRSAQLSVTQGTVYVRVRSLPEGENFEVDTPNLAWRAAYPGDYRIDVNANTGTTRVTIHSGTGAVYGESGQVLPLGGGQQITFRSRDLTQTAAQESPPQDNFDRWAADRNRREDQSVAARYVPREVVGYQQLDAHGQWAQDATFGPVWFPQGLAVNWAPYRNGHWEWISPWGWTWIDTADWGFATFHYGRWAMIDSRWAWVPGRIALKPVYSPALVAFIAGAGGDVAWFPLAPGEAWQPGYPASPAYMSNVNGNLAVQANTTYANQRKPEALTSISLEDFHRGRPARATWLRVAANALTNAQIVPPPPMPERRVVAERKPAPVTRALPPAPPKVQVAGAPASAAAPVQAPVQAQAQELPATRQAKAAKAAAPAKPEPVKTAAAESKPQPKAKHTPVLAAPAAPAAPTAQAQSAEQAKATAQARRAQQKLEEETKLQQAKADEAKRDKLARRAEQARREQIAKRAEQTKRELLAKQAEQARREQQLAKQAELAKREVAKREQARRVQVAAATAAAAANARKAEQVRREEQAKRAEQARREAVARRDEQQRREAHARQVEQARRVADREAQALREQREQREEMQARREAQEREQAQRAAWARQQQATVEQSRREQEAWEQQQRDRARQRPDLRDDRRPRLPEQQRGIPIISGPWS